RSFATGTLRNAGASRDETLRNVAECEDARSCSIRHLRRLSHRAGLRKTSDGRCPIGIGHRPSLICSQRTIGGSGEELAVAGLAHAALLVLAAGAAGAGVVAADAAAGVAERFG